MSIGQRIRYFRTSVLKISQRAFAKQIGISQQALFLIEKDHTQQPRMDKIRKITEIYGVNEGWLLSGVGDVFDGPPPALPLVEKPEYLDKIEVRLRKIEDDIKNLRKLFNIILEKL